MTGQVSALHSLNAGNGRSSAAQAAGEAVTGPGLPACAGEAGAFVTEDCVAVLE